MFFPRLRRQAKWMFVFLALVFGLGYVVFNVGGTIPGTGIADLLRGNATSSATDGPSSDEARDRIAANPKDPTGWRQLADALQREGNPRAAIAPLERYTKLQPKDADGLRDLAGLYTVELDRVQTEVQAAQIESQLASAESSLSPALQNGKGQSIPEDPITQALSTQANERLSALYTELGAVAKKAVVAYKRIVRLPSSDATDQLQLASAAETAGDVPTAIAAYKRFVKLVPDDPSTPLVKQRIKQLESSSTQATAG